MPRSPSTNSPTPSRGFATYKTVAVRKAMEDELQAMLAGKKTPKEAAAAAQRAADEIMRPYVERTALKVPATN